MTLTEMLEQKIQECKEKAAKVERWYSRGFITRAEERNEKVQIAYNAWDEIKKLCNSEGIDLKNEADHPFKAVFDSVGITIKKVPVRYYPTVERMTGSIYFIYKLENIETLLNENNTIGRTFRFKVSSNAGDERILLDYFFKVKSDDHELEVKGARWEGWKCFSGSGKIEGYHWADASVHVREYNGVLQSVAIQKTYIRDTEPIWKKHSADPVEDHEWIGIHEEIPNDLEIPEGEFYYDATTAPPRGRHYREQGILAYDDTEEIVILGIKDPEAEVVEIPREINGKPVTILDERCFANCCYNLRKVALPDTLKEIGDLAFEHCVKLERPEIPLSVTKIGRDIFT